MKVLFIAKTLEGKGGAGRYAAEIIKTMRNIGINAFALTEKDKRVLSYQIITLSHLNYFNILRFFINILRARKYAKDFKIIHAMDFWPYGVYGYFAVLGTNKKLFINGIGTYTIAPFRNKIQSFFLKKAILRANRIFSISEYTTKIILKNIDIKNISNVFYGTFKLPVLTLDDISELKIKYKLSDRYPILLTVGDIKNRKGQLDTLKAVNLLKKDCHGVKYVMVGSDEDIYYIQKIKEFADVNNLNGNYEIVSNMHDDRILSFFYQACDIFLLNSNNDGDHFEGFGGVLLEAAQFGKPVIGSRNCGIESAIKDGYIGYLTEQGNARDIYNKILRALSEKERLGANSAQWHKNFSWDKTVSEYVKRYNAD